MNQLFKQFSSKQGGNLFNFSKQMFTQNNSIKKATLNMD